jgi:invasion protein IalB
MSISDRFLSARLLQFIAITSSARSSPIRHWSAVVHGRFIGPLRKWLIIHLLGSRVNAWFLNCRKQAISQVCAVCSPHLRDGGHFE